MGTLVPHGGLLLRLPPHRGGARRDVHGGVAASRRGHLGLSRHGQRREGHSRGDPRCCPTVERRAPPPPADRGHSAEGDANGRQERRTGVREIPLATSTACIRGALTRARAVESLTRYIGALCTDQ